MSEQEIMIGCLNKRIEQLTHELVLKNSQYKLDDSILDRKIIGLSLQNFRNLIIQSIIKHKYMFENHYEDNMVKEKKKIEEEKKAIIFDLEQKNLELQRSLEIKQNEVNYFKSKLE